jgi:hypothetical protein
LETLIAPAAGSEAVARLDVSRPFRGNVTGLCEVLSAPGWLGPVVGSPPDRPDLVRVQTDLALSLRSETSPLVFRKAALVDLGIRSVTADGCVGEIGWRAASFSPLFPVFAGELSVGRGRVRLHGVYAPPGGQLGMLIDRTMVHRFAERTGRWFLDRLATALDELQARDATPGG